MVMASYFPTFCGRHHHHIAYSHNYLGQLHGFWFSKQRYASKDHHTFLNRVFNQGLLLASECSLVLLHRDPIPNLFITQNGSNSLTKPCNIYILFNRRCEDSELGSYYPLILIETLLKAKETTSGFRSRVVVAPTKAPRSRK